MKKLLFSSLVVLLSVCTIPYQSWASATVNSSFTLSDQKPSDAEQIKTLQTRLTAIKSMDKSGLNFKEKKALRHETRSIKHGLNHLNNGGVYLSVGAILVIVLLLILIL